MSIDSKRRLDWADVAKGIGIILVIAGHSIRDGGALFEIIFKLIYAFHMPLFFSISGFFFSRLNFEKAIGKFVKKNHNAVKAFPYVLITKDGQIRLESTQGRRLMQS